MRILALDPGVKNFAFAIIDDADDQVYDEPTGLIPEDYLVNPSTLYADDRFCDYINHMIENIQPDVIVAERYQYRGSSSVDSECINQMLGKISVLARIRSVKFVLLTPVQWKSHYRKVLGLRKGEKFNSKQSARLAPSVLNEHERDALLLGRYYADTLARAS